MLSWSADTAWSLCKLTFLRSMATTILCISIMGHTVNGSLVRHQHLLKALIDTQAHVESNIIRNF